MPATVNAIVRALRRWWSGNHPGNTIELPPAPVSGCMVLGVATAWPWFAHELLVVDGSLGGLGVVATLVSALAVGGGLGLASAAIRRRATLVWGAIILTIAVGTPELWWLVGRSIALFDGLRLGAIACGVVAIAGGITWLGLRLVSASLHRVVRVVVASALFIASGFAAVQLAAAMPTPFIWATAITLLLMATRWLVPRVSSPWPVLAVALASHAVLGQIDTTYLQLRAAATVFVLACSIVAARLLVRAWPSWWRHRRLAASALAIVLVSFWSLHALLVSRPELDRTRRASKGAWISIVRGLQALGDLDGDGYGVWFGQTDCESGDASVSRDAHERPGNGLDDNCLYGDPASARADFVGQQMAVNRAPPLIDASVVVVVIDALRADALSPEHRGFQAFVSGARTFQRAYPTSTFTVQSLAGMLGGRLPTAYAYRWYGPHDAEPQGVSQTLLATLRARGFVTGAVGVRGPSMMRYLEGADVFHGTPLHVSAAETTNLALDAWHELGRRANGRNVALYVHYTALHAFRPTPTDYAARLEAIDPEFARLRAGIGDTPLWVLTADHGEAFEEHDIRGHSNNLFIETIHVPLMLRHRAIEPGSVAEVTSLLGLSPTLLALVTGTVDPNALGPYFCVGQPECRDMPAPMAIEKPKTHQHGLVVGDWHLIHDLRRPQVLAYDRRDDPGERRPVEPPVELRELMIQWEEFGFVEGAAVTW